jgi:hypothetical protein
MTTDFHECITVSRWCLKEVRRLNCEEKDETSSERGNDVDDIDDFDDVDGVDGVDDAVMIEFDKGCKDTEDVDELDIEEVREYDNQQDDEEDFEYEKEDDDGKKNAADQARQQCQPGDNNQDNDQDNRTGTGNTLGVVHEDTGEQEDLWVYFDLTDDSAKFKWLLHRHEMAFRKTLLKDAPVEVNWREEVGSQIDINYTLLHTERNFRYKVRKPSIPNDPWKLFSIPDEVPSLTCMAPLSKGLRSGIRGRIIWLSIRDKSTIVDLHPIHLKFEEGTLRYNYRSWIGDAREQERRLLHLNTARTYDPTYLWLCKLRPMSLEWTAVTFLAGMLTRREVFCLDWLEKLLEHLRHEGVEGVSAQDPLTADNATVEVKEDLARSTNQRDCRHCQRRTACSHSLRSCLLPRLPK